MRHTLRATTGLVVILSATLIGCNLKNLGADAATVTNDLQNYAQLFEANKTLIEQAATEIQGKCAPESTEYRSLRDEYVTARGMMNGYLGHLALASEVGDDGSDLAVSATAAHSASTAFLQHATQILQPTAAKGIQFSRVVHSLPAAAGSVIKALAGLPAGQQTSVVKNYYNKFSWKGWDQYSNLSTPKSAEPTPGSRRPHLRKPSATTLWGSGTFPTLSGNSGGF